jgi:hypothetical protein
MVLLCGDIQAPSTRGFDSGSCEENNQSSPIDAYLHWGRSLGTAQRSRFPSTATQRILSQDYRSNDVHRKIRGHLSEKAASI